jgi:hypothetical protein
MIVHAERLRSFKANGAVAERGSLRGTGNDADVEHNSRLMGAEL